MGIDLTSWLPNLLGPVFFKLNGVAKSVPRRSTINLISPTGSVTDNPANDSTDISFGGGASTPTGTGLFSVTGGVGDTAVSVVSAPLVLSGGFLSLSPATTSTPGSLSASDKTKLDSVASNATANTASSTTPFAISPTASSLGIDPNYAKGDHTHVITFATVNTLLAAASASINVNSQKITGLATPTNPTDAATKGYADGVVTSAAVQTATAALTSALAVNSQKITGLATPTASTDGANKSYVDARGGWITALSLDLTAQATQASIVDGAVTIAGNSNWQKVNSTNDNTALALTNGTGLVWVPKSTGNMSGGTRTASGLYLPLSSLVTNPQDVKGIRFTIYVSAENNAATGDQVYAGIYRGSGNPYATQTPMTFIDLVKRGHITSPAGIGIQQMNSQSSDLTVNATVTLGAANNCIQAIVQDVYTPQSMVATSQYSSGFPAQSTYTAQGYEAQGAGINAAIGSLAGGGANAGILLGAYRNGSVTALSVTVAALLVEVKY